MSRETVEIDGKGPPMTQRTDSLPCPHCNRAFCNCTFANRTGLTPSELERQRDELMESAKAALDRVAKIGLAGGSFQDFLNDGSLRELSNVYHKIITEPHP